jgi:hypothetical protein
VAFTHHSICYLCYAFSASKGLRVTRAPFVLERPPAELGRKYSYGNFMLGFWKLLEENANFYFPFLLLQKEILSSKEETVHIKDQCRTVAF